ncbi:MAG: RlmE family RNA methyltransferase [bacterium]|nr:RlmE family RNA methyltransferase [bacterium]
MYRKDRQSEPYTKQARREGYPARSVYKVKELDEKFRLFKKGSRVLDLGASPGSWLLYIAKRVGSKGFVLGVDTAPLKIKVPSNALFLQKSVMDFNAQDALQYMGVCDAVVSDMAPFTSGVKGLDAERSLALSFRALEIARGTLKKGGSFVCKVLEGEGFREFVKAARRDFLALELAKPRASKKESRELYVVARGYGKKA